MVGLEVIGPTGLRVTDAALVDTGADVSACPVSWMRRLKIFKKDCRRETIETAAGLGPRSLVAGSASRQRLLTRQ